MEITKENLVNELRIEAETADLILAVLAITDLDDLNKFIADHELWSAKSRIDQIYSLPKLHYAQLITIDVLLENFGIEAVNVGDTYLEYSNTGDTYAGTIGHDGSEFLITSYGDWVEAKEQELTKERLDELEHEYKRDTVRLFRSLGAIEDSYLDNKANTGEFEDFSCFLDRTRDNIKASLEDENKRDLENMRDHLNSFLPRPVTLPGLDNDDDHWAIINAVDGLEFPYYYLFFFAHSISNATSARVAVFADKLQDALDIIGDSDLQICSLLKLTEDDIADMSEDEYIAVDNGNYVINFEHDNIQEFRLR